MTIIRSKGFRKAFKRHQKSGSKHTLYALHEVIRLLMIFDQNAKQILHQSFRDHALKENMYGQRELHLDQDNLLIYRIHKPDIIELLDITTHEELRKRK